LISFFRSDKIFFPWAEKGDARMIKSKILREVIETVKDIKRDLARSTEELQRVEEMISKFDETELSIRELQRTLDRKKQD